MPKYSKQKRTRIKNAQKMQKIMRMRKTGESAMTFKGESVSREHDICTSQQYYKWGVGVAQAQAQAPTSRRVEPSTSRVPTKTSDDDDDDDTDEPETGDDSSLYFNVPTKSLEKKKTSTAVSDKSNELHEGFSCNSCSGNIIGYRYTCVQCANYDLCNSCEARGEHSHHYVLRIPKPAPFAEINAVLSKIRTQLLYGLDNDDVEDQEEAGDPQPCMSEETIKVEIKEELPDPLEHEDAFTTDDNYTETDTTEFSAPKETTTAIVPNVKTSTMTLTESGGNLFIIENPISIPQTVPTISKKHKTTSAATQATKRIKVEPQESDVTCEFMEVPVSVSAGSSTEGGSGELLRQVLTTRKPDEEASFQVFSHTEKYPVEAKPGPVKSAGKKTAGATTKKKKSDANTLNN